MPDNNIIEIEKDILEQRLSQIVTRVVNSEVEMRLVPIRKMIKLYLIGMSAIVAAGVILCVVAGDYVLLRSSFFMCLAMIVWMAPLWYYARFSPRWMDIYWREIDKSDVCSFVSELDDDSLTG